MADAERPAWQRLVRRAWVWEIPLLAALGLFMFWVRMMPYDELVGGERAYYIGTDPFYHFRATLGIVRSFPDVPRFDPFTYYPHGTGTGQFGSLFDWAAAAVVVATAGRGAAEQYVGQVLGWWPAALGGLLVVPFYYLAKRLLGTPGALVATVTLALLPGEFLIRSVAGYSDHHIAEALMAVVAILGVVVAVEHAHAARGDLARWRETRAWRPFAWGALGGVAVWANFLAWPPAILFVAILTIWLTVAVLLAHARGDDPIGYVVGGATAFVVAGALMIPFVESTFLGEFNNYGILHVVSTWLAAAWLVALRALVASASARRLAWGPGETALPARRLGAQVVGGAIGILLVAGLYVVLLAPLTLFVALGIEPATIGSLRWGLSWVTNIGVPRTTLTISEARAADYFCTRDTSAASCLATDFGIVPGAAVLILVALGLFVAWKRRSADVLLLVWSLVVFMATNTQIRFSYYLAVNMALLVGWLGARLAEGAGAFGREAPAVVKGGKGRKTQRREASVRDASPLRATVAAVALLLVVPGNVFGMELSPGDASRPASRSDPGWRIADSIGRPDGDLVMWMDALDWVRQNTPESGVDLGRVIDPPADGSPYPQAPGSYGILSWWDYGHWMEVVARRAPVANPFQQAAPFASCWFTERDPARAEAMLALWSARRYERLSTDVDCDDVPVDTSLRAGDENPVRYVMIDDEMAGGKFGAITVWAKCEECLAFNQLSPDARFNDRQTYYRALFKYWRTYVDEKGQSHELPWSGDAYVDTMLSRLYYRDGNTLANYRLVHETPYGVRIGWVAGFGQDGFFSHNQNEFLSDRQQWAPQDWASTGNRMFPTNDGRYLYEASTVASVKTYEHVKGANLTGSGAPPGSVVSVRVDLESLTTGRQFSWSAVTRAADDGTFSLTVPYATSDHLTAQTGGTNLAVVARGPAAVYAGPQVGLASHEAQVDIPDRAVIEGQAVGVTLVATSS